MNTYLFDRKIRCNKRSRVLKSFYDSIIPRISSHLYFRIPKSNKREENSDTNPCSYIYCGRFSPSSEKLALISELGILNVYQPYNGKFLKSFPNLHSQLISRVEWTRDEKRVFTSSIDQSIIVWKYSTTSQISRFTHHDDWIRTICLSNDESRVASGCITGNVLVFDIQKETTSRKYRMVNIDKKKRSDPSDLNSVSSLKYDPLNDYLLSTGVRDGTFRLFDTREKSILPVITKKCHLKNCISKYYKNNANWFITSGKDSSIRIWDIRKVENSFQYSDSKDKINGFVKEYSDHKNETYNIPFIVNYGHYVITGSEDGNIHFYDLNRYEDNQKSSRVISGVHSRTVHFLDSPSEQTGDIFCSASLDTRTCFVWKPKFSGERGVRKGANKPVYGNEEVVQEIDLISEMDLNIQNARERKTYEGSVQMSQLMAECGDEILKDFHSKNLIDRDANYDQSMLTTILTNQKVFRTMISLQINRQIESLRKYCEERRMKRDAEYIDDYEDFDLDAVD